MLYVNEFFAELDAVNFKQLAEDAEQWMDQMKSRALTNGSPAVPTILLLEGILIYNYK